MFKLNSVGRKLYFSVLAVFLVFAVSFIVFQQAREKQYKIGTLTIKLENYNELLAEDLALSPGEGIILQDSLHNKKVTVAHEKLQVLPVNSSVHWVEAVFLSLHVLRVLLRPTSLLLSRAIT